MSGGGRCSCERRGWHRSTAARSVPPLAPRSRSDPRCTRGVHDHELSDRALGADQAEEELVHPAHDQTSPYQDGRSQGDGFASPRAKLPFACRASAYRFAGTSAFSTTPRTHGRARGCLAPHAHSFGRNLGRTVLVCFLGAGIVEAQHGVERLPTVHVALSNTHPDRPRRAARSW
jgi:hypothetical protein